MNFRAKGGKFYKAEDLQRIWGLPAGFYERVKDHIRIDLPSRENPAPKASYAEKKPGHREAVNINTADSSELESLPGIGPRLASRINSFRDKLGGFYSIEQVGETYGLPDSTFQKIRPYLKFSGEVKKISVNKATREELSNHPYIRWKMANAITEYRKQHGDFTRLEDLKKVFLVDEKAFAKMFPYLSL
jgi:competence ComEA-like helix-hairpin-helix protein